MIAVLIALFPKYIKQMKTDAKMGGLLAIGEMQTDYNVQPSWLGVNIKNKPAASASRHNNNKNSEINKTYTQGGEQEHRAKY